MKQWLRFDRPVSRTVSHCYRTAVKRSLASSSLGEPVSILCSCDARKRGRKRDHEQANGLKDAFPAGTRRTRNRKCVCFTCHLRAAAAGSSSTTLERDEFRRSTGKRPRSLSSRGIFRAVRQSSLSISRAGMHRAFSGIYYRPTCESF